MKKIVVIVLMAVLISCNSEQKDFQLIGNHYFNKNSSQIFHFKEHEMIHYNFIDSTSTTISFELKKENIFLDNIQYQYKNFNNDSIIIYNYYDTILRLGKIDISDFNVNELNNSNWLLNIDDEKKRTQFLKIRDRNGMHFFAKFKNDTIYFHKIPFLGKYFNKFNVYSMHTVLIPVQYNKDSLSLLDFGIVNENEEIIVKNHILKRLSTSKKINPLLIGKWRRIKSNNVHNSIVINRYIWDIDENDLEFETKIDSIEALLDYSKIEFNNNQKLIRYLKNRKIKIVSDIDNTPVSKYLFINNTHFDNQYLEIKKISKDSLTILISEPNFIYNYVRDSLQ